MDIILLLKTILLGIVEGITEWLPISSTGHLILADEFIKLNMTADFKEMFDVVIQLGAIMAVVVLYFHKLNPFSPKKFDDWLNDHFYNPPVVAAMLIIYGVLFIIIENRNKRSRRRPMNDLSRLSYGMALGIGVFQILALIPGTSRSGATILGGILLGCSRTVAAEFSFFLGIPVSIGAIKFLLGYIKKNDFKAFGVYRIILGLLVIVYFAFIK